MNTNTSSAGGAVVGVFADYGEAHRAVADLRAAGFRDDQIGVVGPGRADGDAGTERSGLENDPTGTRWEEGAGIGAAVGAAGGLGLGALVAAGLMTPVGPAVAGGALVALLASAGAGATVGTVVGGLIGLGVPEEDARRYQAEAEAGRILVTVHRAEGRAAEARSILARHATPAGGPGVGTYGTGVQATPY
jgi:hypothetical protein